MKCVRALKNIRSSHRRRSIEKGVLKNFAKFTGKRLCQSLFLIKLQASVYNFFKKETLAQIFSCEFCETFKSIIFTEHLRATASETSIMKFFVKIFNDYQLIYCKSTHYLLTRIPSRMFS